MPLARIQRLVPRRTPPLRADRHSHNLQLAAHPRGLRYRPLPRVPDALALSAVVETLKLIASVVRPVALVEAEAPQPEVAAVVRGVEEDDDE